MLTNKELLTINGGAITAAWLNAAARIIGQAIELGRMIGSAIRRVASKNYC